VGDEQRVEEGAASNGKGGKRSRRAHACEKRPGAGSRDTLEVRREEQRGKAEKEHRDGGRKRMAAKAIRRNAGSAGGTRVDEHERRGEKRS